MKILIIIQYKKISEEYPDLYAKIEGLGNLSDDAIKKLSAIISGSLESKMKKHNF